MMMRIATVAFLLALAAPTARAETVVAAVRGFRNDKGKALVALFAGKKGFPDRPLRAARRLEVPIVRGEARAVFARVPPGTYAISVLHDEDSDRAMKTGTFGIPKEGYGASRDARGAFGPPSFDDAVFRLRRGRRVTARIKLVYH